MSPTLRLIAASLLAGCTPANEAGLSGFPEEPPCEPQAEACDGADNDCDGEID